MFVISNWTIVQFYVSLPDWIHILMVIAQCTASLASSLFSNFLTQDRNFPPNESSLLNSTWKKSISWLLVPKKRHAIFKQSPIRWHCAFQISLMVLFVPGWPFWIINSHSGKGNKRCSCEKRMGDFVTDA